MSDEVRGDPRSGASVACDPLPRVVQRDPDLVVVDKPSGWIVHRAGEVDAPVLADWLEAELGQAVWPVHRLDRETSGVSIFALTAAAAAELGRSFASGAVAKRYVALVHGRCREKGIIRTPLADARRGRPLAAVTRYRLREHLGALSLLSARPETGRRHQIRRHLAGIGHPVVGDTRYGPRGARPVPGAPGRLWLHAEWLDLGEGRAWHVPVDGVLAAHLEALRSHRDAGRGRDG
jgi:tRNA pseudouridine65 synthase